MTQKLRKILIMVVMAALIICLMAASLTYTFTYGRYAGGKFDEESPYGDLIEFVGANQYIVRTPEKLIQAIEDGYSNIKIADDAEEPFVIDTGVTDVSANLVLDLNGTNVIRNSRNPLLDVKEEVSVVLVYDSAKTAGSFYNPVGSNLQVSGGTLTVAVGDYISGPEDGEYNTKTESASEVTLFKRDNTDRADSTGYTSDSKVGALPAISTDSTDSTDSTNFTNKYFEKVDTGTTFDTNYIKDDTFLLYTVERDCFVGDGSTTVNGVTSEKGMLYTNAEQTGEGENRVLSAEQLTVACNVASCDFYYYYPTGGTAGTKEAPQDYAVIYGYWDVKALAKGQYDESKEEYKSFYNSADLVWPYAAVRMVEGEGFARGGQFSNNFGTVNSYGIYANGGALTASGANFTTGGDGVCIRCEGSASLSIGGGTYSSAIGNTIEMEGGTMNVTAGKFTKDASSADTNSTDNGSAIDIQGGTLNSSKSESTEEKKPIQFEISGSHVNGIHAAGGEVNIANASFVFYGGENNQGIYNDGGTSRAHWCDFSISGKNNYGIHSTNGITRATGCTITMTGEYVVGVYTTGGRALIEGGSINVGFAKDKNNKLLTSTAVSTEGGEIYLAGKLAIESASLGVTVRGNANMSGSLEIASDTITTGDGTTYPDITPGNVAIKTPNATGIYVNNGNLTNKGTVTVTSFVGNEEGADNGWSWVDENGNAIDFNKYNGVYVQGGSLESEGTLNVTFTGVENESKYDIDTLLETYDITLPTIGEDGIGSTTQRFWDDDNTVWNNFYTAYQREFNTPSFQEVQQAVSYAVRVEGDANTTVTIASGQITNSVGGGVLVNGGTVDLGTSANNLEIHAEGNRTIDKTYIYTFTKETGRDYHNWWWHDYYEYTIEVRSAMYFAEIDEPAQNWAYRENQTGGDAVRVEGGELTIVGGNYTSAQGNGIVAVGGKTTINGGTFNGSDNYKVKDGNGLVVPAGPAASYAFKVYGGEITVNAGTFGDRDSDSGASGGFVMGTLADAPGTAYINGGTFDVSNGNTGGQAGFGVYRYANVTFGKETDTTDDGIKVTGLAAGLVLERTPGDSGTTVTINSGTFSSTRTTRDTASDGVWYGNGTSKLNITGGTFTGVGRSGIQLDEDPSNNVRITGGIFKANQGYPISGYFNQVVPSGYGIISGSNSWGGSCTIG